MDSDYASMADLEQRKADTEMERSGSNGPLESVYSMWKSGSKYDVAEYLLRSNFLYADFVRLIQMLEPDEAVELGTILDELAPPAETATEPSDLVSAVAGPTASGSPDAAPEKP